MADPLVVFVHGFRGSARKTWGGFERIIKDHAELKGLETFFYSYPTPLFWIPFLGVRPVRIQDLARGLATELDCRHGSERKILLVCHSLGGLVARQFIVDELEKSGATRVGGALLYGTPNTGADLAAWADHLPWSHLQLRQLNKGSDYIEGLNKEWRKLVKRNSLIVQCVVAGQDRIVDKESAVGLYGAANVYQLNEFGHKGVCKPESAEDLRFLTFLRFIRSSYASVFGTEGAILSSALFDYYSPCQEPYYLVRGFDHQLAGLLNEGSIWLSGKSGLGKTVALKRQMDIGGENYAYVFMASYAGCSAPADVARGLCAELSEQLDAGFASGSVNQISDIVDMLSKKAAEGDFRLFIEEIPIDTNGDFISAFVEVIYSVMLGCLKGGFADRITFVLSSIEDPLPFIRHHMGKIRERFQFVLVSDWQEDELESLLNLIMESLDLTLTPAQKVAIVKEARGSPRFVKKVLRSHLFGRDLDQVLFSVAKELA